MSPTATEAAPEGLGVFSLHGFSPALVAELDTFEQGEGSLLQNSQQGIVLQTRFLLAVLRQAAPRHVLETGTHKGHFCYLVRLALPGVEVDTFGLDPGSQRSVDLLNARLGLYARFHPGDSLLTLPDFDPPYLIDLAWIDGGHDLATCLSDLRQCERLRIGHVCVDDWRSEPAVRRAVAAFLEEHPHYEVAAISPDPRGICYLRRRPAST